MRAALTAAIFLLVMAAVGSLTVREAAAEPLLIGISPASGPIGTSLEVSYSSWTANTEVLLYAAFSTDRQTGYTRSQEFIGPVAITMSDTEGRWSTSIDTAAISGLEIGDQPGYIFIRAEGDDMPLYMQGYNVRDFVLTVNGQRPAGSGAIEISITFESEQPRARHAGFGWRRVGNDRFYSPNQAGLSMPGTLTIPSLSDGEFEVALSLPDDLEISEGAHFRLDSGQMCDGLEGVPCYQANKLFVLNVSVVNAEIARADIVLRPVAKVQPADPAIEALLVSAPEEDGRAGLIAGASALLAVLVVGAVAVAYRRANAGERIGAGGGDGK